MLANRTWFAVCTAILLFLAGCEIETLEDAEAEAAEPNAERQQVDAQHEQVDDAYWEVMAPLPEHRTEVSATTDGERIFLIGGFGPPETEDQRATAPRTMWAYSPDEDAWGDIGEIPAGVHHTAFAHVDGQLFIIGGFSETGFTPTSDVHIYDIGEGSWSEGAPMPTPRGAGGFTVLDGNIHVIGGNAESEEAVQGMEGVEIADDRSVNVHERYDPEADEWEELAPMPTPRNHLGAAAVNEQIHAVLGRADGNFVMTTHEVYDAEDDSWSTGPDVPTGRSGVAVLEHDGYVYAFGGENLAERERRTFRDAERFNPNSGEWEVLRPMPSSRHGLGAAPSDNGIFVISGGPGPAFTFGTANEKLVLSP